MKKSLLNFKPLCAVIALSIAVISCEEKEDIVEVPSGDDTVVELTDEKLEDSKACSVSLKKQGDLLTAIHSSEETPKYFKWSVDGQPISNYNIQEAPTQTFDLSDPDAKPIESNFDFSQEVTFELANELPLERLYNINEGDINIISRPLATGKHTVCVSYDTKDCKSVEKCFEINYVNRFPVESVTCVNDIEFIVSTQKIGGTNFSAIKLKSNDALGSAKQIWYQDGEKIPGNRGLGIALFAQSEGELTETNICVVIVTPNCSEGKESKQFCDVLKL